MAWTRTPATQPGSGAWLLVRCRGKRILAVLPGSPPRIEHRDHDRHHLAKGKLLTLLGESFVLGEMVGVPDDLPPGRAWSFSCPAHGLHDVSAALLAQQVELARHRPRTVTIDVQRVADASAESPR